MVLEERETPRFGVGEEEESLGADVEGGETLMWVRGAKEKHWCRVGGEETPQPQNWMKEYKNSAETQIKRS